MRDLILLLVHVVTTVMRVLQPGGVRAVIAESVLTKHQLLILNRPRRRAPNLRILDRLIAGFCSLWIRPKRHRGLAIAFKPSTFLNFHRAMVQRKYRLLFSPKQRRKPGPKGPTADLIRAVIEMKRRNPSWGSPQIAEQINLAFGTSINKDVVLCKNSIRLKSLECEAASSAIISCAMHARLDPLSFLVVSLA